MGCFDQYADPVKTCQEKNHKHPSHHWFECETRDGELYVTGWFYCKGVKYVPKHRKEV